MNIDSKECLDKTFFSLKLGERIKQLRRENNISQSELARRCNKDKQHIELIENGKISPTIYTIYLLANALEIELGKFFDFSFIKE
jgi:putative transcriptional regulator